jgi:hypothetical protein
MVAIGPRLTSSSTGRRGVSQFTRTCQTRFARYVVILDVQIAIRSKDPLTATTFFGFTSTLASEIRVKRVSGF